MKKAFFTIILVSLFLIPVVVSADGVDICSGGIVNCGRPCDDPNTSVNETAPCTLCHFFGMFGRVINFLLFYIIPSLAALMIAIGGFMYILAYTGLGGGGPDSLSRANSLFKAVIIGLVIVYGAWLLVEAFFAVIGVKPIFRAWNLMSGCLP